MMRRWRWWAALVAVALLATGGYGVFVKARGNPTKLRATWACMRVDLARYQTLVAGDAVPKQQLDTQQSLVRQYEGAVKNTPAASS